MHHSGGTVCEPVDLPVNKRHLDMVYAHMRCRTSPSWGRSRTGAGAGHGRDGAHPVRRGVRRDNTRHHQPHQRQLAAGVGRRPCSARREVYAQANQATIITPFILSGAMSPVTVAGTLAQVLAEVLAGIAFIQLVRPGAPVVLRHLRLDDVDAVGRADLRHARGGAGDLRRGAARAADEHAVPHRRLAVRVEDRRRAGGLRERADAGADPARRGNFVLHAAGWLEGGLASSTRSSSWTATSSA